jgi:ERCC4-type nuclease
MILLDPRAGSADYETPLRNLGATVEMTTLEFGDVAFHGSDRAVGIELKKLPDLLNCIVTGRYSGHQLPGMARDYQEAYLIVEGIWRPNPVDGTLEVRRRGGWTPVQIGKRYWMYRDFNSFLETTEIKGGVRVKRSNSQDETARLVYGLYEWWQDFDGHRSHLAVNRAGRDTAVFAKQTFARRVARELPGIGYEKAGMLAGAFPTVRKMMAAGVSEWTKLPGIGKKLATSIMEAWDSEQ